MVTLDVVVPDLLSCMQHALQERGQTAADLDRCLPATRQLLGLSTREDTGLSGGDIYQLLWWLCTGEQGAGEVPVAAVHYQALAEAQSDKYYLQADPVHLAPGRDDLILTEHFADGLTLAQAEAMVAEINQVLGEEHWRLLGTSAGHWFFELTQVPRLYCRATAEVLGRGVREFQPQGPDGAQWRGLINEIQMLLHSNSQNQERLMQGLAMVNSLWIWGPGRLPKSAPQQVSKILTYESSLFVTGLAKITGAYADILGPMSSKDLEALLFLSENPSDRVLMAGPNWDPQAGQSCFEYLQRLENDWLMPLTTVLKNNKALQVHFYPGQDAVYRCHGGRLKSWWRRPRSLASLAK